MIVNDKLREAALWRREAVAMRKAGYTRHETEWQIHRGDRYDHVILDVKISRCRKYVYVRTGKP